MKFIILGAGIQGRAIIAGLDILNHHDIIVLESDELAIANTKAFLTKTDCNCAPKFIKTNEVNIPQGLKDAIVISALPYSLNVGVFKQCMAADYRYYDLGGHINTSESINGLAEAHQTAPVMTDIGLAPGLVNIIAQNILSGNSDWESVKMYCGGLPFYPAQNELQYEIVFSPQGLVNEYFNLCSALIDGQIKLVEPAGDVEHVPFRNEKLEAFNTSGGAHSTLKYMKDNGVQNCSYKTLRHPGHAKILRFMKNDLQLSNAEICNWIKKACRPTYRDKVLIRVEATAQNGTVKVIDHVVNYDDEMMAMQKATAFSAVATIHATLHCTNPVLLYSDVIYDKFKPAMATLLPEISL